MMTFSEMLRQYRVRVPRQTPRGGNRFMPKQSCLSQNELAHRAGINVAYVNRLESGSMRNPSREVVAALADGLGLGAAERSALLRAAGYMPLRRAS
jgi:transcriptional regulator with XRE-family HTH domain